LEARKWELVTNYYKAKVSLESAIVGLDGQIKMVDVAGGEEQVVTVE